MKQIFIKVVMILFVVFFARIIISCCDCATPDSYVTYQYDSLLVTPLDNSGERITLVMHDSVRKAAFAMELKFFIEEIASASRSGSAFSTAQAFSCACEDSSLPRNIITAITITTENDFDASYKAGADVTDLFKVLDSETVYKDLDEYIAKFSGIKFRRDYYQTPNYDTSLKAFLITPPSSAGPHSFKITVSLSDAASFVTTTDPIVFY